MTTSSTDSTIAVIGGGVTGLTTALLLQLSGLQTTLYATEMAPAAVVAGRFDSRFASVHAAASILPHSVRSPSTSRWTEISQTVFESLAFLANCGVRAQRHFEVFEADVSLPSYWGALKNPALFGSDDLPPGAPKRANATRATGWAFDAYFCEVPTYLRFLHSLFVSLGGSVRDGVDRSPLYAYLNENHTLIVNCCGVGASEFLDIADAHDAPGESFAPLRDPWGGQIIRGHWLRLALAQPLAVRDLGFISYNYTPTPDIYPGTVKGTAADVYCYPRSDAWILGGSRQSRVERRGLISWAESNPEVEHLEFKGAAGAVFRIPAPILNLNDELIASVTDGRIQIAQAVARQPGLLRAGIGYRFERTHPDEGVRLERSRAHYLGREYVVIHNYGHGGAGYTLSWGCAYDVLSHARALITAGWKTSVTSNQTSSAPLIRFLQGMLERISDLNTTPRWIAS